jgi:hypothetical protein
MKVVRRWLIRLAMNPTLTPCFKYASAFVGCFLLGHFSILKASPVNVQDLGMGADETVIIDSSTLGNHLTVYAGIINLSVNGVATQGFCIDPWHYSVSGVQSYTLESLTSAPKAPGPMSQADATQIEDLWTKYFSSTMSDQQAAGLQIAIWETVSGTGGATFSLVSSNDYGAAAMIAAVQSGVTPANLVALTGPGQDYVIPSVADSGTTLALLSLGVLGLFVMRRKFQYV